MCSSYSVEQIKRRTDGIHHVFFLFRVFLFPRNDDLIEAKEIRAVLFFEYHILISNIKTFFRFIRNISASKFNLQGFVIYRLVESCAEFTINLLAAPTMA